MKVAALLLALLPGAVVATVNGHCSGSNAGSNCICLHRSTCIAQKAYHISEGSKGDYPCPYDASDVVGCYFYCGGQPNQVCEFTDGCKANGGRLVPGNLCPGGNNYACCAI